MLNELKNKNETNNNSISLDFDIQRYLDVDISDSNLYKQEFGIKDAIPISLNLKSFIFIKTSCIHGILHNFKLPIKTEIKWKIQGGIANGAFKIGNGMDAEYFPQDSGDSVIFYPQLQNNNDNNNNNNNNNKNLTYKKVCIELIVKQLGSSIFKEQEYPFFVNVNILISRKFAKRTFRIKMFVSEPEDQNKDNKVDSHIAKPNVINSNDLKSTVTKIEKKEKEDEEGKNYQISFTSINNSCKICNLSIIIKTKKTSSTNHPPFSIKGLKSYLITSDIIKISAEESNNIKNNSIANNNDNSSIILTGSNYKKYFINNIQIQPRIFWKSNIGELVYGNLGQSSIYYTPGESKLSKSPITITLYFQYDHNLEDIQQAILSDSKKVWILRQEMCVHC
ncbi:MAG TPA: hypothetical protein VFP49_00685 [Nitrososphaeraceae archaeon]|nr:hypothetical protein [Nitrososphaeraceae archaeon]